VESAEDIQALTLRKAMDSEWGCRRIWGELKMLRINVSRSTVARILKENGFDLGPKRGAGTWNEFVRRHIQTLWACDFFTKKVWMLLGPVEYYVLFFVHVATRRVHVVGMTPHPNGVWMEERARGLLEYLRQQGDSKATYIIRDRDTKFTAKFCSILKSEGIQFRPIPPLSPNLNAFAEAWVQRVKRECLDHFMVFAETHLRYFLECWLGYYHRFRPSKGRGTCRPNLPIGRHFPWRMLRRTMWSVTSTWAGS
jgi:putative transposase